MKALVIGGAGYIGGVTTQLLNEVGHDVVVLDNLSTGHGHNLPEGVQLVEGDMGNRSLVEQLLRDHEIDTVLHFAAKIRVDESMADPKLYFDNNTVAALTIIDAVARADIKNYIFSSTAAVYGNPDQPEVNEEAPTKPVSPYGVSKRLTEQILESYGITHGLNWLAFRYFNAAGAYKGVGPEYPFRSHLITIMLENIAHNEPLTIFGDDYPTPDGTCIRDYIHVWDLARAHVMAAEQMASKQFKTVVNLGTNRGHTVKEVIGAMSNILGQEVRYQVGPRRPGDASQYYASNHKAKELLGWQPEKTLDDMLRDAHEWDQALRARSS